MRKDQWSCTVAIDGFGNLGVFDTADAGSIEADTQTWNPGGMAPPISIGGIVTPADVEVTRMYVLERDHPIMSQLMNVAGAANMTLTRQPLDINKIPFGKPIVQRGVVKTVACPEHDSNSSDADTFSITMTPGGSVG